MAPRLSADEKAMRKAARDAMAAEKKAMRMAAKAEAAMAKIQARMAKKAEKMAMKKPRAAKGSEEMRARMARVRAAKQS
jgi:hypothetical protein